MQKAVKWAGPVFPVLAFFVFGLIWLGISRGALSLTYFSRLEGVENVWWIFPIGLRMDVITLCFVTLIPAALLLAMPATMVNKAHRAFAAWFTVSALVLVFMEIASGPFVAQYDARPNRLFFEYLNYPREVFATVWAGYKLYILAAVVAMTVTGYFVWNYSRWILKSLPDWSVQKRLILLPVVLIVLFIGGRSSLGVRPAGLSTAAFSTNHLANEMALNSTYSVVHAIYARRNERNALAMYGTMPREEAIDRVRRHSLVPLDHFSSDEIPTLHRQESLAPRSRPYNIVIFLQESLGAEYVGSLGGLPLTPNLDRLSTQGMFFTNLYATGTRTVRGIEAVAADYLPTPSTSVVKLALAQNNFFTVADLLQRHGYSTEFIYAGSSNFDNMRSFFLGNGFQRVIDENDFANPTFHSTWGVSDEDLVRRANDEFKAHGDKPFFALMLSVSNHEPFEYPAGKIELYDTTPNTVNNAIKYADYAIGQFFKLAEKEDYFKNTIFLVVADHDTRVWGADLVPIAKFHIPALILGAGVPVRKYDKLASQLDLLPTMLNLAGLNSEHPMIGRDVLRAPDNEPGHAIMQYLDSHAFRVGERVVIHQPNLPARQFTYTEGKLVPDTLDPEFARDGLAHIELPYLLYNEQRYRLPPR